MTTRGISQGLALLQDLEQQRQAKRARFTAARAEEPDDDLDTNAPHFEAILDAQGPQAIVSLVNFSPSEFNLLWADLRQYVAKHWNVGSGRKSEVSGRDLLLMSLAALKHCGTWDVVAVLFQQKVATFEKRVMGFLAVIHPYLMSQYVTAQAEKWTMQQLHAHGHKFVNFPSARYATDVTFQQSNTPSGSYADKKMFFSGKHKLYGHKVEVSVLPNGMAMHCTAYYKGSVSDKAIFDENLAFHVAALTKQGEEADMADRDAGEDVVRRQWAVMADKGYQGIQRDVRAVLPVKNPKGGVISAQDEAKNDRIASDRVIVENFFGRLKTLWGVVGDKYHWSRKSYDLVFQCCLALTNVHAKMHPLRAEDGDANARYTNRLMSIGAKLIKNKKTAAATYRSKRKARLAMFLASESALTGDAAGSDTDFGSNSDLESADSSRIFF